MFKNAWGRWWATLALCTWCVVESAAADVQAQSAGPADIRVSGDACHLCQWRGHLVRWAHHAIGQGTVSRGRADPWRGVGRFRRTGLLHSCKGRGLARCPTYDKRSSGKSGGELNLGLPMTAGTWWRAKFFVNAPTFRRRRSAAGAQRRRMVGTPLADSCDDLAFVIMSSGLGRGPARTDPVQYAQWAARGRANPEKSKSPPPPRAASWTHTARWPTIRPGPSAKKAWRRGATLKRACNRLRALPRRSRRIADG